MILIALPAEASEWPEWAEQPSVENERYRFYIGRSDRASSESEAYTEAFKDAYESAIRENFGFQAQIEVDGYESPKDNNLYKRVREASSAVRIQGFEKVHGIAQKRDGKFAARALYRYEKAAIERERQRLARLTDAVAPSIAPSVLGSDNDTTKGSLEITTIPAGAKVFIDGEPMATTPVKIVGRIEPGPHQIRLDHPNFLLVEEEVLVLTGTNKKIAKSLKPAFGDLMVTSNLEGTEIFVNGKNEGTAPLMLKVPAGESLTIEARHPQGFPQTVTEIMLERDQARTQDFSLTYRPAELLLTAPKGCSISLNGKQQFKDFARAKLDPGRLLYELDCTGYEPYAKRIDLQPNEKRSVSVTISELRRHTPPDREPAQFTHLLSINFEKREPTLQGVPIDTSGLTVGAELVYDMTFGISAAYGIQAGEAETEGKKIGVRQGTIFRISPQWVPFSKTSDHSVLYLATGPELTELKSRYYSKTSSSEVVGPQKTQVGYGWSASGVYVGDRGIGFSARAGVLGFEAIDRTKGVNSAYFAVGIGCTFERLVEAMK